MPNRAGKPLIRATSRYPSIAFAAPRLRRAPGAIACYQPLVTQVGPLKLKAQLRCGAEWAIGPGKADLLEAIAREGSISAAGRALGMSYRRAWLLVDAMNRCWKERLVETLSGGGRERGARLTPMGQQVLATYRALERHLASEASLQAEALAALLRDEPLAKPQALSSRS